MTLSCQGSSGLWATAAAVRSPGSTRLFATKNAPQLVTASSAMSIDQYQVKPGTWASTLLTRIVRTRPTVAPTRPATTASGPTDDTRCTASAHSLPARRASPRVRR